MYTLVFVLALSLAAFLIVKGISGKSPLLLSTGILLAILTGAIISGIWWFEQWDLVLKFAGRISTDMAEPILERQTGFYLFTYPLLQAIYNNLLFLGLLGVGAALLDYLILRNRENGGGEVIRPADSLYISAGVLLIVLAYGRYIARYGLLFSDYGIVSGPGWTDVNIRLPMLAVIAVITAGGGLLLILRGLKFNFRNIWGGGKRDSRTYDLYLIVGGVFWTWFLLLAIVPMLFQWLKVEPNEITAERPYIENNIRFTRSGFHLDKVEINEYPASEEFTQQTADRYSHLLDNIRLWDYRALDEVFKQFQEIRLYYEFRDVDIDRYTHGGDYRQVMVSAREMQPDYIPRESRIMIHRRITERVSRLAPFLEYDEDPYIVISEGKLYWIIHAYNGDTDLYIFEEDDPLIRVYDRIFPGLFKKRGEMPENLMKHIRYPADMLLVQGLVYARYHMTDPAVFYNQEDLWVRATEKYYNQVQPVEPYYIMWQPPGSDEMEFILMLPFTPRNKQVETKIDQDPFLSGQLTLWDQRGSNVIRGNVLAIPIGNTLLYVEPIYLKSETSAYPELRLVTLMHNDNLSFAETFDEALRDLLGETADREVPGEGVLPAVRNLEELISSANEAFDAYLRHMQAREFEQAGEALRRLESTLNRMSENGK